MASIFSWNGNNNKKDGLLDDEKKANSECGFAGNLVSKVIESEKDSNIILSPYSILSALTICMNGARENTLQQMNDVLYPSQVD